MDRTPHYFLFWAVRAAGPSDCRLCGLSVHPRLLETDDLRGDVQATAPLFRPRKPRAPRKAPAAASSKSLTALQAAQNCIAAEGTVQYTSRPPLPVPPPGSPGSGLSISGCSSAW